MRFPTPTINEIKKARELFEANEPRDLFYRAATELVDLAMRGESELSVAEAIAVLLQTWNRAYYTYRPFDSQHFSDIEHLLERHQETLAGLRQRSIESFCDEDEATVKRLFQSFEEVLGPVGASKSLHLLAPCLFPLWDRAISAAYGVALEERGTNGERYCRFMGTTREQCQALGGERNTGRNPLKAVDEYNYCKYTKEWM